MRITSFCRLLLILHTSDNRFLMILFSPQFRVVGDNEFEMIFMYSDLHQLKRYKPMSELMFKELLFFFKTSEGCESNFFTLYSISVQQIDFNFSLKFYDSIISLQIDIRIMFSLMLTHNPWVQNKFISIHIAQQKIFKMKMQKKEK